MTKPTKKRVVRVKGWAFVFNSECYDVWVKEPDVSITKARHRIVPCTISYQLPATKGGEAK